MPFPKSFVPDSPTATNAMPRSFVPDTSPPVASSFRTPPENPEGDFNSFISRLSVPTPVLPQLTNLPPVQPPSLWNVAKLAATQPLPQTQHMEPGAGRALARLVTVPNVAIAGTTGLAAPEMMATALGRTLLSLMGGWFGQQGLQTVSQAGQQLQQPGLTPGQQRELRTEQVIGGSQVLPVLGARFLGQELPRTGLTPYDVPDVSPQRQLPPGEVGGQRFTAGPEGVKDIQAKVPVPPVDLAKDPAVLQAIKEAGYDITPAPLQDVRPAVRTIDNQIHVGDKGMVHVDIINRDKIPADQLDRRLFVDAKGNEISREQLGAQGVRTEPTSVPGAHASKLAEAQGIKSSQPTDYTPEDLARYDELGTKLNKDNPNLQQDWKERETIKNKYGGQAPKQREVQNAQTIRSNTRQPETPRLQQQGGEKGGGGDIQQKTQGTSYAAPQAQEPLKVSEEYGGGFEPLGLSSGVPLPLEWAKRAFVSQAEKILRDPKVIGFAPGAQIDATQMKNRLRNKLGSESTEWKILQDAGIEKVEGKVTSEQMMKWVEENTPKVEVRKFGKDKISPELTRYNELSHTWLDSLTPSNRGKVESAILDQTGYPVLDSIQHTAKAREYLDLRKQVSESGELDRQWSSGSHWQSIAPKSEQDMPGYVEIAVVKPQNRLPAGTKVEKSQQGNWRTDYQKGQELVEQPQFPSTHNFPPNTLGFVRGYMETLPNGEKVFHVIEVQSDWAQREREYRGNESTRQEAERLGYRPDKIASDPLLPHYERLALKAAIEHARSEGATKIAISDAETAMMTEGHDISAERERTLEDPLGEETIIDIPQQEGMRLHYDRTLPKIAEELTGDKGLKVSFGEHKNAYEHRYEGDDGPEMDAEGNVIEPDSTKPRSNLIFRNEAGQPKTDVSARMFSIEQPAARLATGEPFSTTGKMYSGIDPETLDRLVMPVVEKLGDYLKRGDVRSAMTYRRDAVDNISNKIANEGANDVLGPIRRMSERYKLHPRLVSEALSPVREVNGDKARLESQVKEAEQSKDFAKQPMGKEWLRAAKYGLENWDVVNAIADRFYKPVTDKLIFSVIESGKDVEYREGYVRHLPESEKAASFTHGREYPTLYDRIKAGSNPKSINAVDLLRSGIADAQRLYVQTRAWINWAEKTKDPVSGKAIVVPYEGFEKGRPDVIGAPDIRPPSGYTEGRVGGQRVGVLEPYSKLLEALTERSWFDKGDWKRQAPVEAAGAGKHILFGFDTVHLGRMALVETGVKVGTGGLVRAGEKLVKGELRSAAREVSPSFSRGVLSLDYSTEELGKMLKAGEIDKEQHDTAIKNKTIIDKVLPYGVNIGRVHDALHQHWTEHIPLTGHFQKWLFGTFQRGAMAEVVPLVYEMNKRQYPKYTEEQILRKTATEVNTVFRNLGRQGGIKSATGQDFMRLLMAAPQWTIGTLKYEGGALGGTVKGLTTGKFNLQSRTIGSIIVGYLLFNQAINMATRGQFTWENKEPDHKLDAWVPSVSGEGGFWLNPTASALEATHAIGRALEREGDLPLEAARDWADPKLSTVARPLAEAATGRAWGLTGPRVPKEELPRAVAEQAVPKPIWASPLLNPQEGKTQQQVMRSFGMNVDAMTTDRSQVYQLARKWMRKEGVKEQAGDFEPLKYLDLTNSLRRGDLTKARSSYDALVKSGQKEDLIERYFKNYPNRGFTKSEENEEKFKNSLDPDQRALYDRARQANELVTQKFFEMLGKQAPQPAPRKKGKKTTWQLNTATRELESVEV